MACRRAVVLLACCISGAVIQGSRLGLVRYRTDNHRREGPPYVFGLWHAVRVGLPVMFRLLGVGWDPAMPYRSRDHRARALRNSNLLHAAIVVGAVLVLLLLLSEIARVTGYY
jgi:hypothetical protein